MRFYVHTLGCPKNEVDSEGMAQALTQAGHESVSSAQDADIIVVNTCGFIEAARRESLRALRDMATLKLAATRSTRARLSGSSGSVQLACGSRKLIAAGCLSERYGSRLRQQIPGIDAILGTRRWAEIVDVVDRLNAGESVCWTGPGDEPARIVRAVRSPSAYVKIADGCSAGCTFCAIPGIKGPQRSRPLEAIVEEVGQLVSLGVKEVILVAQDTTAYGRDLGWREGLATLLDSIVKRVPDVPWIRLLYAYPQFVTPRLLDAIARHSQVLKYIDLPLQHAHPDVLRRMGRPAGDPREIIGRIRSLLPGVALRTTFLVGFPGETEDEFASLLDFIREMRFDRVGVFTYSAEEGTPAATMPNQVSEQVKRRRYDRAMRLQQTISLELNRRWVGETLDVLIEGRVEGEDGCATDVLGDWVGRSFRDAPEIDGLVFVRGEAAIGQIVPVRIAGAMEYDLVGEVVGPRAGG